VRNDAACCTVQVTLTCWLNKRSFPRLRRPGPVPLASAKPFHTLCLSIIEPRELAGRVISGRVYCTAKALWKLGWFLRDFLYDPDLLGREEVDEKALSGLRGVVKISHTTVNGTSLLNFDGFAPTSQWVELSSSSSLKNTGSEVA